MPVGFARRSSRARLGVDAIWETSGRSWVGFSWFWAQIKCFRVTRVACQGPFPYELVVGTHCSQRCASMEELQPHLDQYQIGVFEGVRLAPF